MAVRLIKRQWTFMLAILMIFFLGACAPKLRTPVSQLDTPGHHTFTGMRLLDQENYPEAEKSFNLALQLNPRFSQAHAGLGLVKAYQKDFKAALAAVDKAEDLAKSNEERVFANVAIIRVHTLSRAECMRVGVVCKREAKDWLDKAENAYERAVKIDPKSAYAHYHMGLAYKTALDFTKAGNMFQKVLELKGDHVKEADQEWNFIQKVVRALPGTQTGRQIAFVPRLTRADAAALFVAEMRIHVLFEKRTPKTFDTAFRAPDASRPPERVFAPADIANHPLKADIDTILKLGVRGLEVFPDGTFKPDLPVDRAGYAMMLEDIIVKITGDSGLTTRFIGQTSPFPDLRADLPYFNAVMVATTRGFMGVRDFTTGEFGPTGPVAGVDALLSIRQMREALKF